MEKEGFKCERVGEIGHLVLKKECHFQLRVTGWTKPRLELVLFVSNAKDTFTQWKEKLSAW